MTDDLDREWKELQRDELVRRNMEVLFAAYHCSFSYRLKMPSGRTVRAQVYPRPLDT